jgi:hypothetical protein
VPKTEEAKYLFEREEVERDEGARLGNGLS